MVESILNDEMLIRMFNRKPIDIPIVAITGGKGGTGKTSIAVNLAFSLSGKGRHLLLIDVDVDSPTAGLILGIKPKLIQEVKAFTPRIVKMRCDKCGKCVEACRAHALIRVKGKYPILFEDLCSGCEACLLVCPKNAIENGGKVIGYIYYDKTDDLDFIGGELKPNEARSAQVVSATKSFAFEQVKQGNYELMIVDTPPGTHCNVVQGLRGADLALAVTEPTPLGIHDLSLILELTAKLGIQTKVVINRANMPGGCRDDLNEILDHYKTEVISEVPLDKKLFQSYISGTPIVVMDPDSLATKAILKIVEFILDYIEK